MRSILPYLTLVLAFCVCTQTITEAATLHGDEHFVWGIDADEYDIPVGSIITEAVLTIENPSSPDLYVHLLDNPDVGSNVIPDEEQGNVFEGFGVPLQGQMENGNLVFHFSQITNDNSDVWNEFSHSNESPYSFNFTLSGSSAVQFTSSLLKLIDYAGTGRSFGLGIDSDTGVSLDGITLNITVSAYADHGTSYTTSFAVDLNDDLIIGSVRPDFNGDGKTDLLWRENSTGAYTAVIMDGSVQVEEIVLGGSYDDLKIVSLCDFDGDGKSDILWRQINTGTYCTTLMNGSPMDIPQYIGDSDNPDLWVLGTGDFDGDGNEDLLWNRISDNVHFITLMDGATPGPYQYIGGGGDPDIGIVDLGDYNGDGMTDLLWNRISNNAHFITMMNNASPGPYQYVGGGGDFDIGINDLGDFDGDGMTDFLWDRISNNAHFITLMDGTSPGPYQYVGGGNDFDICVIDQSDYDGDGRMDFLWSRSSNNAHFVTLMNGTTSGAYQYVGGGGNHDLAIVK